MQVGQKSKQLIVDTEMTIIIYFPDMFRVYHPNMNSDSFHSQAASSQYQDNSALCDQTLYAWF